MESRGVRRKDIRSSLLKRKLRLRGWHETCYSLFIKVRGLESGFQPFSVLGRTRPPMELVSRVGLIERR